MSPDIRSVLTRAAAKIEHEQYLALSPADVNPFWRHASAAERDEIEQRCLRCKPDCLACAIAKLLEGQP